MKNSGALLPHVRHQRNLQDTIMQGRFNGGGAMWRKKRLWGEHEVHGVSETEELVSAFCPRSMNSGLDQFLCLNIRYTPFLLAVSSKPCEMMTWPSGLRRKIKALVRKGVGSNPTVITFAVIIKTNTHHSFLQPYIFVHGPHFPTPNPAASNATPAMWGWLTTILIAVCVDIGIDPNRTRL